MDKLMGATFKRKFEESCLTISRMTADYKELAAKYEDLRAKLAAAQEDLAHREHEYKILSDAHDSSEEDVRRKTEALENMLAEIKDRGFIRSGELVDIANIGRAALKERDAEAQP